MKRITDHGFLRQKNGELALILTATAVQDAVDPVLLVSKDYDRAYLRRSKGDVHKIVGIDEAVLGDLRKTQNIVVLEMIEDKIQYSYDVPVDILENEDDQQDTD